MSVSEDTKHERELDQDEAQDNDTFVVKLRGLPWSTSVDEIIKFFSDCTVKDGKNGVHMTMSREGRPSGEAYVEMETEEDIERACKKDRDHMGQRYIEVFRVERSEMEWVVKRSGMNLETTMDDGCVRLRGLPFGCSKEEISNFFDGLEIVPNGISLPTDYTGRSTGEAYVQFISKEVAEKALLKHKEKIGHRYIEIFRSSLTEVRQAIGPKMRGMGPGGFNQRPAPYDRGDRFGGMNRYNIGRGSRNFKGGFGDFDDGPSPWGSPSPWASSGLGLRGSGGGSGLGLGLGLNSGMSSMSMGRTPSRAGGGGWGNTGAGSAGGYGIHMRGLPFRATEQDIADADLRTIRGFFGEALSVSLLQFFRPVVPINIKLLTDNTGRPSGEADVEFSTHEDTTKAMSKNKTNMQHRYIELFLNSTPNSGGGNFGGFGGGGNNSGFGGGLGNGFQRNFSGSSLGGGYNNNYSSY
uniref:RRM domain-containing protein n=1 Tax=Timema genevievae TaxID=629358 RepID=A0A7R9PKA2_TIMGE|nr:unnamed protein product [Timema genevievae]